MDDHRRPEEKKIHTNNDDEVGPSACKKRRTMKLFGVIITVDSISDGDEDENIIDHEPQVNGNLIEEEEVEVNPVPVPVPVPPPLEQLPVFLFKKELEFSDINSNLNRLLIRESDKLMAALREDEQKKVENVEKKSDFLRVVTTDPRGVEYILHLKKWSALRKVVLIHQWRKLVQDNTLHKGDSVQAWGYRHHHHFRLALNIIRASTINYSRQTVPL